MSNLDKIDDFYDVLIVGGGIVGCGIFRDMALNSSRSNKNIKTLMIEKGDYCSQTSQSSSKMLHGGIRYLEHLDFTLVYEALQEKNLWLKLAPHLCYEDSFHLPVYQNSKYPFFMFKAGLMLYDFLSLYKNTPHSSLRKKKLLKKIPQLNPIGLRGAGIYYDAVVDDSKLGLECLYDGLLERNAHALSYTSIHNIHYHGDYSEVELCDELDGSKKVIKAKEVVFATGPFTDQLLHKLNLPWKDKMIPSKGIHIWIKKEALDNLQYPIVLQTKDNRVIFVIPQRDAILAGTTEKRVTGDFFNIQADDDEIQYLKQEIKSYFPKADLKDSNIISSYAGIRPLVKEKATESEGPGNISRQHKIFSIYHNIHTILGGKYTTFRIMAQDMSKILCNKLGISYSTELFLSEFRQKSIIKTFEDHSATSEDVIKAIIQKEQARTSDDVIKRRLSVFTNHYEKEDLVRKYLP
jgi:glycerol-3-phosphate dehydrogenase